MDQPGLFGDSDHLFRPPPPSTLPDPAEVRRKLHRVLDEARSATGAPPWPQRQTRYWRTVFPQMANWLPDNEADELRRAFGSEMQRLGA